MSADSEARNDDVDLVSAILEGSEKAWHDFVERYSGLILGVIRRQLFEADEDQVRTIYVEILSALYNGALGKYKGRSSLSTWLIVSTRNRAHDYLRSIYGRTTEPAGFEELNKRDRQVFKLFFVEMLPLEAILLQLRWSEPGITTDDIVQSLYSIENTLTPRYLNNLSEKNRARIHGIKSVKLARYLLDVCVRDENRSGLGRPDADVIKKETESVLQELRRKISELPEKERKILFLRFNRGLSAKDIAEEMDVGGQRQIYTIIDRAVRKLRNSMETE